MTVSDVFELRRQGKIEEAYEAIRPMYAVHKGRYTSLCMFWTASDIFILRLDQGRKDEAEKIYRALLRMLPNVQEIERQLEEERGYKNNDDSDSALSFMEFAKEQLEEANREEEENQAPSGVSEDGQRVTCLGAEPTPAHETHQGDINTANKEYVGAPTRQDDVSTTKDDNGAANVASPQAEGQDDGIIRPREGVNAIQRIILACLVSHPGYATSEISHSTGLQVSMVESNLDALVKKGLVEHRSTAKADGYFVL